MWKAQRRLPGTQEGCKTRRGLPSSSWGCPELAQSSPHLGRQRVGARGHGQGAAHPRSPIHLGVGAGGSGGGVAPRPCKSPSSQAQTSRQSNCQAAAANASSQVSRHGQGPCRGALGGRGTGAAATYRLQQRDGVLAALHTRGEARRGGRAAVFGGLCDELGDRDQVRSPAEGSETQAGAGGESRSLFRDTGGTIDPLSSGNWLNYISSCQVSLSPIFLTTKEVHLEDG